MYERMGFIVKKPVHFDHRLIAVSATVDPALIATAETYRNWSTVPLTPEEAAMLLGGLTPHEREPDDDDSWWEGFELLLRKLNCAVADGALDAHPTLTQLVDWARHVGWSVPEALQEAVALIRALQDANPNSPSLEAGRMQAASQGASPSIAPGKIPGTKPNFNPDWQHRIEELAAKERKTKRRAITKKEVAIKLADELAEDRATVERQTKKTWGRPRNRKFDDKHAARSLEQKESADLTLEKVWRAPFRQ